MAGELGLELDLDLATDLAGLPPDVALFSESNGRFVVTTAERDAAALAALFPGLACTRIGKVTRANTLRAKFGGRMRLDLPIDAMKAAYKDTLAHV
jgi:phosphoribosylformylglycinamidine synthase